MLTNNVTHNNRVYAIFFLIEYSIVFLFICRTGAIWFWTKDSFLYDHLGYIYVIESFLIIFLAVLYAFKNGTSSKKSHMVWIFVCGLCLVFTLYSNLRYIFEAAAYLYLPIISALSFATFTSPADFQRFMNRFIKVMLIIASVSLFFWLFGSVLKLIPPDSTVVFEWGGNRTGNSYFGLYFEPRWQQMLIPGYGIYQKNCGIFTETPMYCFLLSNAYCFYRLRKEQNIWVKVIFLVTIFSAVNITAITSVFVFETIRWVMNSEIKSKKDIFRIIVILCLSVVCVFGVVVLVETKLGTGSGHVRMDHLQSCIKAFISSFPFGRGIVFGDNDIMGLGRYRQGMSMGVPYLFAQGGLGVVVIVIIPILFLLVRAVMVKCWEIIAFLAAFFWSLFCTAVIYRCHLYWILLCYCINWGEELKNSVTFLEEKKIEQKYGIRIYWRGHRVEIHLG